MDSLIAASFNPRKSKYSNTALMRNPTQSCQRFIESILPCYGWLPVE